MVAINIEVDEKIHEKARILALKQKKTLIVLVNEAIKEKVEREKNV